MAMQITEGSPILNTGVYYHAGRGGVGNYCRLSAADLSSSPPSTTTTPTPSTPAPSSKIFFGGRGGAGNAKLKSERAMFSFDEELERDRLFHQYHAPVYSIGRGGAGNVTPAYRGTTLPPNTPRCSGSFASSAHSAQRESRFNSSSVRSGVDKVWDTLTRVHSRS